MAAEIVPVDTEEETGLNERQVRALEKLFELGAEPRAEGEKYNANPQIRAFQMVYEGRFGGPQGAGSMARNKRVSVTMTDYIRSNLVPKMQTALRRALEAGEGSRINLDAIKLAVEIEHKEAKLQLDEDTKDLDNMSKEELFGTLIALVAEEQTRGALEATFEDLPFPHSDEAVAEEAERAKDRKKPGPKSRRGKGRRRPNKPPVKQTGTTSAAQGGGSNGDSSHAPVNGTDSRSAGPNGRGGASADRPSHPNPVTQAALRRAANRR